MRATPYGAFIGRVEEVDRIRRRLRDAGDAPCAVLVTGEAGIGKSRLITEAVGTRTASTWVLRGECVAAGAEVVPLAPLLEGLRRLVSRLPVGPDRDRVEVLLRGGMRPEDGSRRASALEVLAAIGSVAAGRRVLLIIDDLQWADAATLAFAEHIARNVASREVSLIGSIRTTADIRAPVARVLAELLGRPGVVAIDLAPLDTDAVARMVRGAWGEDTPDEVVERVAARSRGLPLYVDAIVATGDRTARRLPADVRSAISASTLGLDALGRQCLTVLATALEPIPASVVEEVVARPPARVEGALRALAALGLATRSGDQWGTRHPLIRESVLAEAMDDISGVRRRLRASLRDRAAASPDRGRAAELLAQAARHAELSGDRAAALRDHMDAAETALQARRIPLASVEARRALRLARRHPDAVVAAAIPFAEVELLAGQSCIADRRPTLGLRYLLDARTRAEQSGHQQLLPRIDMLRIVVYGQLGLIAEAAEVCERLVDDLAAAGAPFRSQTLALSGLVSCYNAMLRPDLSAEPALRAYAMALETGEPALIVEAGSNLALMRSLQGRSLEARELVRATAARWRATRVLVEDWGDSGFEGRTYALSLVVATFGHLGLPRDAERFGTEVLAAASAVQVTRESAEMVAETLRARFVLGDWAEILRTLREVGNRGESTADRGLLTVHARIEAWSGRFQSAARLLGRAPPPRYDPDLNPWTAVARGELAWLEGRRERTRAVTMLIGSRDQSPGLRMAWLDLAALALAAEVDGGVTDRRRDRTGDGATRWLQTIRSVAEASLLAATTHGEPEDGLGAQVERLRLELERSHGRAEPDRWEALAARWASIPGPLQQAYALMRAAEAVGVRDLPRATTLLVRAAEIARRLSAWALAWKVERTAAALGIEVSAGRGRRDQRTDGAERSLAGLTERESEVARLVAQGASNREIAAQLLITEKTASIHVSNILHKLGVQRRGEIAAALNRRA
ncbi:MAG: AAA family ATPase [Chloroflexota bacterium]